MSSNFDFSFELSEESIGKLQRNIKNFEKELEKSKTYILKALSEYTYNKIMEFIPVGNTGKLKESIKISPIVNDMVRVYTNLAYASYVEFGTGIVGKGKPHSQASEYGWKYDVNEHGKKGWVYKSSEGNFYWTDGQEGAEYMYKAWLELKENYLDIARKVLKERGLIK